MKLKRRAAPHIRFPESNRTLMSDVILLLLVLCVPAYLFYGIRALAVCGVSVAVAVVSDAACVLLRGRRPNPRDFSPVVTGLIIALTMPATVSFKVVAAAAFFAIAIVKHPFGGTGNNLFNPAAAGFSFAAICWPQQVFLYPMPFDRIDLMGKVVESAQTFVYTTGEAGAVVREVAVKLYQNPAFVLKVGSTPTNSLSEMLLGNYPGPMGATNILVIVTCLLYLLFRRTVRCSLPVSFLAACAAMAFLFPRIGADGVKSVTYEMMSGAILFGAVFVITDPATSPKRDSSLAIYGIFAGIVTMLFRYLGGYEESMSFAVLFANAFVPVIDRCNEALHRYVRRKNLDDRKSKKVQKA